jgi:hypothetical protein
MGAPGCGVLLTRHAQPKQKIQMEGTPLSFFLLVTAEYLISIYGGRK